MQLRVLPHPPYFSDLAPSDIHLFPNPKTNFRGRNFGSNEGVIDTFDEYLGNKDMGIAECATGAT